MAMFDADDTVLGLYFKTHIPDVPGFRETFYFIPDDTGYHRWRTAVGHIDVGICWDQWFPEAARAVSVLAADFLLYPTAISSEPQYPSINSCGHWQRTMHGHGAANMAVVVASNKIGSEALGEDLTFYGGSFIADETGDLAVEMAQNEGNQIAAVDLHDIAQRRAAWGIFRDREPETYAPLR